MKLESSFLSRTERATGGQSPSWFDHRPAQVGLAAALRRAFDVPDDEDGQDFEELLRKLH